MNAWDVVTWLSAVALAARAVVLFWFFLRDARSILNREMHGNDDEDAEDSPASGATPGTPPSSPPEDRPR